MHGWCLHLYSFWLELILLCFFTFAWIQPETEQRPHKVSFFVDKKSAQEVIKSVAERLDKRGVRQHVSYIVVIWFWIISSMYVETHYG